MKKILLILSVLICVISCTKNNGDLKIVKIGVVGDHHKQWEPIISALEKDGVKIQIVQFSDYTQPNTALANGDIDMNAFQHYAYLENELTARKYNLTVIGETTIVPLGLYSKKIKSVDEFKNGDKIAIPGDATNGGRSLRLLENANLIVLKNNAGMLPVKSDIIENPLNLEIIEIEAAQTPRLLQDVTASIINGGHAIDAGFLPVRDSIFIEKQSGKVKNPYINIIVVRTEDKDNPVYKKIVQVYQTDEVANIIEELFKGAYIPVWK